MTEQVREVPRGDAAGFVRYLKYDLVSGFLVFLIALPLCLGISLASGYPPIAGIFTAIVGAVVATVISNSELTIKGPAAGLIVIAVGCIQSFGGDGMVGGWSAADTAAYKAALAVGVAAAVLQIVFGFFRAGILGEFFPVSAVHGMLAAIGVIIIAKQIPVALGVTAKGEPLELLREIPRFIAEANPAIAAIGLTSIAIMFLWPMFGQRVPVLRPIPSPLVVLVVAIPMGMAFDLLHEHSYVLQGHEYQLGEQYLVEMPERVFGMFDEVTSPDFAALAQPMAWKWVFMFFIIGTLESVLSAKAVDLIDPWKRKASMDRDIIAVGAGNLCVALVGGLPMISEIVRSKANIDNGARTRFANFWHGMFLLLCVALIPMALHRIPLAALAAMLVYTGFRLAHPTEFVNVFRIGREQLVIFVTTLIAVLATDLLIGIAIGITAKFIIHVANGVPVRSLFKPGLEVSDEDGSTVRITTGESAVFSNWIAFRRQIEQMGLMQGKNVILDVSNAKLVDHSVMDKLHEMENDFHQAGLEFRIAGLEVLQPVAGHEHSARRRGLARAQRLTVVVPAQYEYDIERDLARLGVTPLTAVACSGADAEEVPPRGVTTMTCVRIELIASCEVSEAVVDYLRRDILPRHQVSVCVEDVGVLRLPKFGRPEAVTPDREEEPVAS